MPQELFLGDGSPSPFLQDVIIDLVRIWGFYGPNKLSVMLFSDIKAIKAAALEMTTDDSQKSTPGAPIPLDEKGRPIRSKSPQQLLTFVLLLTASKSVTLPDNQADNIKLAEDLLVFLRLKEIRRSSKQQNGGKDVTFSPEEETIYQQQASDILRRLNEFKASKKPFASDSGPAKP